MNCSIATETMLEADPQDLTGDNDSDLARHIAACARCRAIAEHLVQGQLGLARELDELSPQTAVDEAIQIAGRRASAIRRRNLRWQIGTPLAAAAGLVGLVLLGGGDDLTDVLVQARAPEPLPGLEVTSPPGKDVAVFQVRDRPDVVVVWFFDVGDE